MLDQLSSYGLSDFLLFSQETYYRLFELYNRDVWPLQILALALATTLLWLLWRRPAHGGRLAAFVLTLVWAWVGWAFHLERYATINLAAPKFAALFVVAALMIFGIGFVGGRLRIRDRDTPGVRAGIALVLFAACFDPLIGLTAGRRWSELSIFGLAPDPTAIATIGVLIASKGRLRWLPAVPAVIWCLIAILTSLAMDSIEFIGPAAALVVAAFVVLHDSLDGRRSRRTAGRSADAITRASSSGNFNGE